MNGVSHIAGIPRKRISQGANAESASLTESSINGTASEDDDALLLETVAPDGDDAASSDGDMNMARTTRTAAADLSVEQDGGDALAASTSQNDYIDIDREADAYLGLPEREAELPLSVRVTRLAIIVGGLAWLFFGFYLLSLRGFVLPQRENLPAIFSTFATPLALLGVIYVLIARSSVVENARFTKIASNLRQESEALEARLGSVNTQLMAAQEVMREQAALIESFGASASSRLEMSAGLLSEHANASAQQSERLLTAGAALNQQFGQIIENMPTLEKKAAVVAETLADGSHALLDKVERLEARLETLVLLTDEARNRAMAASKSLVTQLKDVQEAMHTATDELTGMSELSSSRMSTAIDRARQVMDEIGLSLDTRMADLNLLVDQSQVALSGIGGAAISSFGETIDNVETRLHELNRLIEGQSQLMAGIDTDVGAKMEALTERFANFENDGIERNKRMGLALEAVGEQTQRLALALQQGNDTAASLIARSETLLNSLDANFRQLDEAHPAILEKLNDRIEQSRDLLALAVPEIENMDEIASTLFARTRDADALLRDQSDRLSNWLSVSETAIVENREQLRQLEAALHAADEGARRLADSSGPQLVAALLRVKDTAEQAAERARHALSRAISDSAARLGDESEAALREALGDSITKRVNEIATVSERAVKAAHLASDKLMRQLITINETSADIEQRVSKAEKKAEERNREQFTRRSSKLVEMLNSASIDIAKALSADVSDSSWAAYIKGDRGVFTRRAVRLLDSGEARSVATLYDQDKAFREHVNRYIHDFEAMLRGILANPEGGSISVTLLSSDMGKLYVALAQAIDRLRG